MTSKESSAAAAPGRTYADAEAAADDEQFFDAPSTSDAAANDTQPFVDAPNAPVSADAESDADDDNWDPFPDMRNVFPPSTQQPDLLSDLPPGQQPENPEEELPESEAEIELAARREREAELTEEQIKELTDEASTRKASANQLFVGGDYGRAIDEYDAALAVCPLASSQLQAVLWGNRAAAHIKLEDYETAIGDCSRAIDFDGDYAKAYYRRALCYERDEHKWEQALADYEAVLRREPGNANARHAAQRLPAQIQERNARMQEEMMGKLKDLGNMVLRPFGLSTENFALQPNGEGGYSVQMKK